MKANIFTLLLVLLGAVFLATHFSSLPWMPVRIAGAVIAVPSLALLVVARIELGRSFAVVLKDCAESNGKGFR